MGYFDSSKNRALWEIRLGELKRERAAREAGKGGALSQEQPVKQAENPSRVRVTYQELLKEEAKVAAREKGQKSRAMDHQKTPERQKEADAYEKGK